MIFIAAKAIIEPVIVEYLNEHKNIEKIIFVPVSNKYNKPGLIEDKHRYNMLKKVCNKNSRFDISRIEMDNERQLFTIETLLELQKEYLDYLHMHLLHF